jgi:hypothetical protein
MFIFYSVKVMALAHSPRFLNLSQTDLTLARKTIIVGAIRKNFYFVPRRSTSDFLKSYQVRSIAFGFEFYRIPVPADGVKVKAE